MGLLRSVKDGVVAMDLHQLNGANRGMERDVGQEARLNVVKKSAKLIACFRSSISRLHIIPALERILAAIGATLR